jgi:purine-binding chemotaxis protein CheW
MQTEHMAQHQDNLFRPADANAGKEGKYLTFSLAGEEYGIGILKVKEIIGMMSVTHVPQTPDFVKGVINLRGKVIPVVDLRLRFHLDAAAYTERTCIIVVEVAGTNGSIMMGIVVDAVSEVLNVRGADIENTPAFGVKLNTDYILGMAKVGGGIKILLEIDKVLGNGDMSFLAS